MRADQQLSSFQWLNCVCWDDSPPGELYCTGFDTSGQCCMLGVFLPAASESFTDGLREAAAHSGPMRRPAELLMLPAAAQHQSRVAEYFTYFLSELTELTVLHFYAVNTSHFHDESCQWVRGEKVSHHIYLIFLGLFWFYMLIWSVINHCN